MHLSISARIGLVAGVLVALGRGRTRAAEIVVEPDDSPAGPVVNNVVPEVSLFAAELPFQSGRCWAADSGPVRSIVIGSRERAHDQGIAVNQRSAVQVHRDHAHRGDVPVVQQRETLHLRDPGRFVENNFEIRNSPGRDFH